MDLTGMAGKGGNCLPSRVLMETRRKRQKINDLLLPVRSSVGRLGGLQDS